jgi:hypothetical protein
MFLEVLMKKFLWVSLFFVHGVVLPVQQGQVQQSRVNPEIVEQGVAYHNVQPQQVAPFDFEHAPLRDHGNIQHDESVASLPELRSENVFIEGRHPSCIKKTLSLGITCAALVVTGLVLAGIPIVRMIKG